MVESLKKQLRAWLVTLPAEAQPREREIGENNTARIASFLGEQG